jgi:hypothetical protein
MFGRLFRSTLLLLLAFCLGAHGSPVDLHRVAYVKHTFAKQTSQTTISKAGNQASIVGLLAGDSNAAHLTSQNYRHAHVIKEAVFFNQLIFASLNCSKYISRSSETSFSRFRKLVLFPFHAFW